MKIFKHSHKVTTMALGLFMLFSCSSDDDGHFDDEQLDLPPIVLDCDYFSEDRILTDDPQRPVDYIIPCYADVQGSLRIEPGVVIEFEKHAGLWINLDSNNLEIKGNIYESKN